MQIEAFYDNGRLEFTRPLRLKHGRVRLLVTVPDDAIEEPKAPNARSPEVAARARALLERLDNIRELPLPPDEELPEWTEKQGERLAAFELRSERCVEQGRSD